MYRSSKDYYRILGVSARASDEEIKAAFKRLAVRYHPDKNVGEAGWAREKFKEISEAYAVLGNRVKRQEYDRARWVSFAGCHATNASGQSCSEERVFWDALASRHFCQELASMLQDAGLRSDEAFVNDVLSGGNGFQVGFS